MKHPSLVAVIAAVALGAACGKPSQPVAKPAAPAAAAQKPAGNSTMAQVAALDPKSLITDDRIARYVVCQREMNTVAGLVMGSATRAYSKSGQDAKTFEKELSKDERSKKIADTQASALSKSGLSLPEYLKEHQIVTSYVAGATIGTDEMKKKAKDESTAKYGPEVVATLDRHLPELDQLLKETLDATIGKK